MKRRPRALDRAEAELAAAIQRRRDAECGPWEIVFLWIMVLAPLAAFVLSVVAPWL